MGLVHSGGRIHADPQMNEPEGNGSEPRMGEGEGLEDVADAAPEKCPWWSVRPQGRPAVTLRRMGAAPGAGCPRQLQLT